MQKALLSITILFFSVSLVMAQSLSLSKDGNPISNGDQVIVFGDSTSNTTMYAHIDVTNNTNSDLDVLVKKVELDLVSGSQNYFCWGMCYTPLTYVSPTPLTISANATTDGFDGEYQARGNLGESQIMYVFYPESDTTDTVAVVVNYMATPVGVQPGAKKEPDLSDAYPNPANEKVYFTYELPADITKAKIVIRNMIGAVVKEARLSHDNGEVRFDTYDLNEGIYFYSYILNDQIYVTRKFVIQHR
ncbi:MAG: T9SS type A sorting domain-containing protein [Bacteroidales bacterium]